MNGLKVVGPIHVVLGANSRESTRGCFIEIKEAKAELPDGCAIIELPVQERGFKPAKLLAFQGRVLYAKPHQKAGLQKRLEELQSK